MAEVELAATRFCQPEAPMRKKTEQVVLRHQVAACHGLFPLETLRQT